MPADWQLPEGVPRSLWEFAADRSLPEQEAQHLARSPLLSCDMLVVQRWFGTPGRLIDLGCGSGRSLGDFAAAGWECTGVDLSQPALEFARRALAERGLRATLVRANLCELDTLPAGGFDHALLLFGTLGMIATPQARGAALRHACRLLRPGGRLALHVHSLWPHLFIPGGRGWLLRDLVRRAMGSPVAGDTERDYRGIPRVYHHVFSWRELRRVVREAGLELVRGMPLRATPRAETEERLGEVAGMEADRSGERLEQTGWGRHWRCTGWLVEARKPEPQQSGIGDDPAGGDGRA